MRPPAADNLAADNLAADNLAAEDIAAEDIAIDDIADHPLAAGFTLHLRGKSAHSNHHQPRLDQLPTPDGLLRDVELPVESTSA